jgi:hypothetical protein
MFAAWRYWSDGPETRFTRTGAIFSSIDLPKATLRLQFCPNVQEPDPSLRNAIIGAVKLEEVDVGFSGRLPLVVKPGHNGATLTWDPGRPECSLLQYTLPADDAEWIEISRRS